MSAPLPVHANPVAMTFAAALVFLTPSPALAQESGAAAEPDLRLPISLDADSTSYDGKNSMLMFHGLRLSQGSISIQADEGRASNLDFEDSVWQFSGNVIFDVQSAHIECESADLRFSGHKLQKATVTGSPATFELQRPESDVVTYAEAGRLEYDFEAGVIEFADDAMITEAGNTISSDYFVYDIEERRINAGESRITYTPRDSGNADSSDEPSAEDADDADGTDDRDDEQ